jgi:hypothetical protein
MKKKTVEVTGVKLDARGENIRLRVKLFNHAQRTAYAYGSPRRIYYDDSTGSLTLHLHDRHVQEHPRPVAQPGFVPLAGNAESEIRIWLPKTMKRLRGAAEREGTGPLVEELRVSEATRVCVEIAYRDTPFYHNPHGDVARQLREWGSAIASATVAPQRVGRFAASRSSRADTPNSTSP